MKLRIDQNLSPFFCRAPADLFPGSIHVRDAGLREASDGVVWQYAAEYGYTIVTKDADFRQRSFLFGHPPKVVWLAVGNWSARTIETLLGGRAREILDFQDRVEESFLV